MNRLGHSLNAARRDGLKVTKFDKLANVSEAEIINDKEYLNRKMSLIFIDVEGNSKGYSPFKGGMSEFGAIEYKTRKEFHGITSQHKADLRKLPFVSIEQTMKDFAEWLSQFKNRPVMVSDNPAYDFMWINYYFEMAGFEKNPLGHSARRISDFYAGLTKDWRNTQRWKRWRVTPHTHCPIMDCRGNIEAFEEMCKRYSIDV